MCIWLSATLAQSGLGVYTLLCIVAMAPANALDMHPTPKYWNVLFWSQVIITAIVLNKEFPSLQK